MEQKSRCNSRAPPPHVSGELGLWDTESHESHVAKRWYRIKTI